MSLKERLFHAVLFEILAIFISVLAVKLTTAHQTASVTLVIYTFFFNWAYDHLRLYFIRS